MLPLYLMGNFHCIGMCGPLVAMIGRHRYRLYYFLGRLLSFTLAGLLAGSSGAVLDALLAPYHLGALTSFLFGGVLLLSAMPMFFPGRALALYTQSAQRTLNGFMAPLNQRLTPLMLQDRRFPTFLFGFFTIALPCGQTIIVYSACALLESGFLGSLHGALFALLTSPSLFLAMQFHRIMPNMRRFAEKSISLIALLIACLAFARGFAELDLIPHLTINQNYHLTIF